MAEFSKAVRAHRYGRVQQFLREHQYDALAVTGSDWFEWLANYAIKDQSFERPYVLLVTADGRSFSISSDLGRYGMATQSKLGHLWVDSVVNYAESPGAARYGHRIATQWQELVVEMLRAAGLERGRIATEGSGGFLAAATSTLPQLQLVQAHADLRNVRRVKHAEEIQALRQCAELADWTISAFRDELRPGRLLTEINYAMAARLAVEAAKRLPGENFAIQGLKVTAGPSTVCPDEHAVADQVLKANDGIMTTNLTTVLNGFNIELARPWIMGLPDKRIPSFFDCAEEAQRKATEAAAAGRPISIIHSTAQKVFEQAGYAEYFMMRAGHGIGIVKHDFPVTVPFDDRPLLENETYAIEPSLYVVGIGVFRFADTILVTSSSGKSITQAIRDRSKLTLS